MSHACKILQPTAENINLCVDLLRNEALVGVPTETVYGLAGNALKEVSVRKIFEVKGRPLLDPLIVHFSSIEQAEIYCLLYTSPSPRDRLLSRMPSSA